MGAGPAGSSAAALLAQQGHQVLVLEKERFPRYHIGESLVPGCLRVFDALGVRDLIDRAGFVVKRGVTFRWGGSEWSISFAEQPGDLHYAYQVDRARFDDLMLGHARRSGARVHDGVGVHDVSFDAGDPVVHSDAGTAQARYVIDATGQAAILGRRVGERRFDEALRNVALWRYFRECPRLPPPRSGDIAVTRHGDGWWWYIPLEPEVGGLTSVGVVMSAQTYGQRSGKPAQVFDDTLAATPEMFEWLRDAQAVSDVYVTADWSYRSTRVTGDRWLLAGDAAGFIDPLLSTGCYLALTAGYLAALCVGSALDDPALQPAAFRYYVSSYDRVVDEIHQIVRHFYKIVRPAEAFAEAQAILGEPGDPRTLFIQLAAGLTEHTSASALPSEVFGPHSSKAPTSYGVPFSIDQERVLCKVEPEDLPPGSEPMMLVEKGVRLRLVPQSAAVDRPVVPDVTAAPPRQAMAMTELESDDDVAQFMQTVLRAEQRPAAMLLFKHGGALQPFLVGLTPADTTPKFYRRLGPIAVTYFRADDEESPLENARVADLLGRLLDFVAASLKAGAADAVALHAVIVAGFSHGSWELVASAVAAT